MITSQYFNITSNASVFASNRHIANKQHCSVWVKSLSNVWTQIPYNDYDLVNNSIILNNTLLSTIYSQVELRVADSQEELGTPVTDISTTASIRDEVIIVADNISDITTVSDNIVDLKSIADNIVKAGAVADNMNSVVAVANDLTNINIVASNKTNIDIAASNITEIQNASTNASIATTKALEASNSATSAYNSSISAANSSTNASNSEIKANKWADNNYNVEVEDGKYSAKHWATVSQNSIGVKVVENISSLKTFNINEANQIEVLGYYTKGDGGGGLFYWDSTSTEVDNGGTIIQATGVTTGRWNRQYSGAVNVKWFGAVDCTGMDEEDWVDSTEAIQSAIDSGEKEIFINGIFIVNEIVFGVNTRKVFGGGTLKMKNSGNGFLCKCIGANDLLFSNITFDGNKNNQTGATPSTRSNYALLRITDSTSVGVTIDSCVFFDSYYGANIMNSGQRTTIINNKFYNGGMVPFDGTCDAIFTGVTEAEQTYIANNIIQNCSDYGIALDCSNVKVENNTIIGCLAGVGSLTRMLQSNHVVSNNTIFGCQKPIDYFNSVDSLSGWMFDNILIEKNTIASDICDIALISFAGNNTSINLGNNIFIKDNSITIQDANTSTGISYGNGTSSNKSSNIQISGNSIFGDGISQTDRVSINIINAEDFVISNNFIDGTDRGIHITQSSGISKNNTLNCIRDAYSEINNSTVYIDDVLSGITRWGMLLVKSTVTFNGSIGGCQFGLLLYSNGGNQSTLIIEDMSIIGTQTIATIYVDGTDVNKVVFKKYPSTMYQFSSNKIQSQWNINQAPADGSWVVGQKAFNLNPTVGQPKGWVCTASGSPGTWVSYGNL